MLQYIRESDILNICIVFPFISIDDITLLLSVLMLIHPFLIVSSIYDSVEHKHSTSWDWLFLLYLLVCWSWTSTNPDWWPMIDSNLVLLHYGKQQLKKRRRWLMLTVLSSVSREQNGLSASVSVVRAIYRTLSVYFFLLLCF